MTRHIHPFPAWQANPYLNLLYLAPRAAGWTIEGSKSTHDLYVALKNLGAGDILHVHWTSPILAESRNATEADACVARFAREVGSATDRGVRLVWTVHNAITHDADFPDAEIALARHLANMAQLIIQLNPMTASVVSDSYELPAERVRTLPHSSYLGVYADSITETEARTHLGLAPRVRSVGFLGQIRRYKGIDNLLSAMNYVSDEYEDLHLLLAGKTSTDQAVEISSRLAELSHQSTFVPEYIPDDRLQFWLKASDVIVLPYEKVLNSGSVFLAATFGRPVVLPNEPHLLSLLEGQRWVTFFDRDAGPAALAAAIEGALSNATDASEAARAFARSYTPFDMSRDYREIIEACND